MSVCVDEGCQEHYGCGLRAKGVQVSPQATPNRRNTVPPRDVGGNSWEKGRVGTYRPDGSFMPYLHPDTGQDISTHEFAGERGRLEPLIRRAHSAPIAASGGTPKGP